MERRTRTNWADVMPQAAAIAASYTPPPTLRQVFYRLVAAGLIPNTETAYKRLSSLSSKGRRNGTFPHLTDSTRRIARSTTFTDPADGIDALIESYRLDRTVGQPVAVWVIVEKNTLEVLSLSVADPLGVPVVALKGYGSQTIIDDVSRMMLDDGRPVAVVYVGDFDPTGEDIPRDFLDRLDVDVSTFTLVAVTADQITGLGLVPMPGKKTDSRSAGFEARHGELVQVEAEAIDPDALKGMIGDAVNALTDLDALGRVMENEAADIEHLQALS